MISNSSTRKTQLSSRSLLLSDLPLIGPAMPYDEKGEVKQWNEIFCPLITWFKQRRASFCITSSDNFQSHGKAKMKGPEKKVILFGCLPVALYAPHAQSHVHINHMTSLHVLPSFKYVCPFWHAICNFYFLLSHTVELDDKFYGCFFLCIDVILSDWRSFILSNCIQVLSGIVMPVRIFRSIKQACWLK